MHEGWAKIPEILASRRIVTCHSAGFLLASDREGIVLAGGVHGAEAHGVAYIPRGAIRKMKKLR